VQIRLEPGEFQTLVGRANTTIEWLAPRYASPFEKRYEITCSEGAVCLSIPSALGPRSVSPYSDVFLLAHQSYSFALRAGQSPAFISVIENSELMLRYIARPSPRMMAVWKIVMIKKYWRQVWGRPLDFGSSSV
jgi:hypothetical protein